MSQPRQEFLMNEAKPGAPREPRRRSAGKERGGKQSQAEAKYGLYGATFTVGERRLLDALPAETVASGSRDEKNLLRIKILRMARLTPLKKVNDKELDALIKLVRVVAALDALERTQVMVRKADGGGDPVLQALAGMDPEDL